MEVVAMNSNAPFKREVHEWKHIDAKTGAFLSGRAEANRYVNGNINTYGKSLLQSLETSDGTQHKQHKQMNILQTITSTGSALQVVRAQTIQTSHSSASSRRAITSTTYSSHYTNGGTTSNNPPSSGSGGDLLSIPRALHHQHHETTAHSPTTEISSRMKALLSSTHFNAAANVHTSNTAAIPNDNHLFHHHHHHANNDIDQRMMKNNFDVGMEEQSRQKRINEMLYGNNNGVSKESFGLLRGKSASIEELANIDDDDDDLKPYEWKRVSKIRRSLQFPTTETKRINFHHRPSRPADLPENSVNVWKIRQDIENGCKSLPRNTAMKMALNNNQGDDFVALNSILKEASPMDSLNSNHSSSEQSTTTTMTKDECVTAESLQDIRRRLRKMDKINRAPTSLSKEPNFSLEQNCKSLELRKNKERDINADEWLNRRKSYGFEKMHQPSESLSGTVESSVDSGLGLSRSSDLPSNWSPTNAAGSEPQRTIITFGNDKAKPATTSISLFNHAAGDAKPIPLRRTAIGNHKKIDDDLKRHSIAVDEKIDEHYQQRNGGVDRKISLVNLNGRYEEKSPVDGRQKKVEFCKTEIHFAADSGRVNIVETNTKPPPTNNFRRRRRSNSTLDSEYPSKSQQQELQIEDDAVDAAENGKVTTTIGSVYDNVGSFKESDTDTEGQSEDGLRGILKNKPVKPRPYHLGENLESGSSLWGVRLKPVENQHTTWRHSADLESAIMKKSSTEDALDVDFKNLVKAIDDKAAPTLNHNQFQSTVSSNGYSTKINLSSLPAIQQHPEPSTTTTANKDISSLFTAVAATKTTHIPSSTFTSFTDSRHSNNGNKNDDKDQQQKGHHKISIDLKLPHPSSMNTIMDELKSTSLIIKTMKSTSYFDDAMKHLERESPFIRSSSLRLTNESLPKSSSTNSMFYRNKPNPPVHRYSSSLDGDHGILDGKNAAAENKSRDDDFDFLNGFLEENRKFQLSIAQRHQTVEEEEGKVEEEEEKHQQQPPIAAPRLKKIMNSSQQLSQQLSQLKHLYDNENDSDEDNAKADEEVKSFLSKTEDEKSTELSGSWSRVRVKKIASAFQHQKLLKTLTPATDSTKWQRTPLTSLYENSTSTSSSSFKVPIEATPRTSKIQIGVNHEKVNSNIYSNVQQQDKSVKVNIQNFESLTPSLSRSNSLRVKKEDLTTPKLSTGTRQLKAHELTYFGIKSAPSTIMSNPIETSIMKSSFVHLSNSNNNKNNTKSKTNPTTTTSKVIINHHQKPDLIMHHPHTPSSVTPELTSSEKKSMIETLDSCIDETKNLEPLYENLYNNNSNHKQHYDRKSDLKRDEKILFELSRAADEIMETCKEMYQHDSDEKRRKSQSISNGTTTTCLETISECNEGRHQRALTENEAKTMKSKGVQVSRNFEDSLRRYHRTPQQRTSSQSSVESLPQKSSKVSSTASSSLITTRIKRGTVVTKSTESKSSSATTASSRKRENGNGSDASRRIHRVCSRERMQKSNASSSESDLPNSSVEMPRRPRRTKVLKHHRSEENGKDEKKASSSRSTTAAAAAETSSRKHTSHSSAGIRASADSKVRSSVNKSSSSTVNPNSSLSSPANPTSSSRKSSRR